MKKLSLILITALLFLGCGSDDSDGAKRLEIQKKFDKGETEEIIDLLENDSSYQTIYPDSEYKLYLGSAYLTRAGFTLGPVVELLTKSDEDSEDNSIDTLLIDLSTQIDLFASIEASAYFSEALYIDCNDESQRGLSNNQKEVCLFIGITGLLKTAKTLSYIVDIDALLNSDGNDTEVPGKTLATACALEYAFRSSTGDYNTTCTNGSTLVPEGNVTFNPNNTYEHITVTVENNDSFAQLLNFSKPFRSTVLVDGSCRVDYSSCVEANVSLDCYACPLAQGDVELPSTNEILLKSINEDLSALTPILPKDKDASDPNAVDDFKNEITGGEDRDVTEEDLINYFQNQNDDNTTN